MSEDGMVRNRASGLDGLPKVQLDPVTASMLQAFIMFLRQQQSDERKEALTTKVTSDLMHRLTREERKPQRRRPAREKRKSVSPLSTEQSTLTDDVTSQATSTIGSTGRDTYLPLFPGPRAPFGVLFEAPIQTADDLNKELAPVYQAIEESEKIAQQLSKQGEHELEKVKEMVKELKDKQYRAPSNAPRSLSECEACYRQNQKEFVASGVS